MDTRRIEQARTPVERLRGLAVYFFQRKILRRDLPLLASFKLTYRCNLRCAPCPYHRRGDALRAHIGWEAATAALDEPSGIGKAYPHQLSGGQLQRAMIALALAGDPGLLIADEPTTALDLETQARILTLLRRLADGGRALLLISHDLAVVAGLVDRVVVLFAGEVVEAAPTEALFAAPNHPYTSALLTEVPRIDRKRRTFVPIAGEIPSPLAPPPGCHFHPRCPRAMARCSAEVPALREIAPGRLSACHLND